MAVILLVDDEESPRATLALLLKQAGHEVVQADGVEAAARVLGERAFDLVITDLRMPDGSGLEVVRRTRSARHEAEVIVLTAYAGWESAKEAMRLGAFDYFEKGREPEELFHRIDQALEKRALRRENRTSATRSRPGTPSPASSPGRWRCSACSRWWCGWRRSTAGRSATASG